MAVRKTSTVPSVPSYMRPQKAKVIQMPQKEVERQSDTKKRILVIALIMILLVVAAAIILVTRGPVSPINPGNNNQVIVPPKVSEQVITPSKEPEPSTEPTAQATVEPTTQPTIQPTTEPEPTKPSIDPISVSLNFIFTDSDWEKVFVTKMIKTGERYGGLAVNLAKDTTVYAPFDGYVHRMWAQDKSVVMVMITTDPEWVLGKNDGVDSPGYYSVSFAAKSVDLLVNDQVKKGDPLFKLSSDESIWDQYLEGKHNLVFYPGGPWSEIGNPSEDPKEYMAQLMVIIETE